MFAYDGKHWPLLFEYMKSINIIIKYMGNEEISDYEK